MEKRRTVADEVAVAGRARAVAVAGKARAGRVAAVAGRADGVAGSA
jgi:hypothetical protein